jgi:hypothetical protein
VARERTYRGLMHQHRPVAPRVATPELELIRREGRVQRSRITAGAAAGVLALVGVFAACTSPGSSGITVPSPLASINASAIASAASAAASVAAQAALTALDQVDTAIAANQTSGALTADDASSLTQLTSGLRTALQSGDMTSAKTALDNLSTKVDSFASKLTGDAGTQLKNAIAALKAAMPTS